MSRTATASRLLSQELAKNPINFTAAKLHRLGVKLGVDLLIYNPVLFWHFHRLATFDAPVVAEAMCSVFPDARRFADVGSGSGAYAAALARRGRTVGACEHSRFGRWFAGRQGLSCSTFDLNLEPPSNLPPSDVAYCFEVAEHVPPPLGRKLVDYLLSVAPAVLFTAAQPNQGGHGHINEQPREYWIAEFARAGAVYDAPATEKFAGALRSPELASWWLASNCSVFRRQR